MLLAEEGRALHKINFESMQVHFAFLHEICLCIVDISISCRTL